MAEQPSTTPENSTAAPGSAAPAGRGSRPATEPVSAQPPQPPAPQDTGPIGEGDHEVRDGECMSSIAKTTGHFWETIWNDPGNSELKSVRKDPNVLLPGDRVVVPPLRPKQEPGATEQHHRFRRKGEPAKLRIRLVREPDRDPTEAPEMIVVQSGKDSITEDPEPQTQALEDEPRAAVPYILDVDGERYEGTTDADGYLEAPIPGNARKAKLLLNPGTENEEELDLVLGRLDPISEYVGVKQRLANLTFECGDRTDELTDGLRWAIKAFQHKHGLEETGDLTEELRNMIQDLHGA